MINKIKNKIKKNKGVFALILVLIVIAFYSFSMSVSSFVLNEAYDVPGTYGNGIHMDSTGTKAYFVDYDGYAYQRTLTTAWDFASMTATEKVSNLNIFMEDTESIYIDASGTRAYFTESVGAGGLTNIYQCSMTGGDISTLSFVRLKTYDTDFYEMEDIHISSDGSKIMFINDEPNLYLKEIVTGTMSTPWDISTISLTSTKVLTDNTCPRDMWVSSDGTSLFLLDSCAIRVYEYSLTTPWLASSLSLIGSVRMQDFSIEGSTRGIEVNPSETKMFILDTISDLIVQAGVPGAWPEESSEDEEVPDYCSNGVQDQDESGVDCGGSCSPCGTSTNAPSVDDLIESTTAGLSSTTTRIEYIINMVKSWFQIFLERIVSGFQNLRGAII